MWIYSLTDTFANLVFLKYRQRDHALPPQFLKTGMMQTLLPKSTAAFLANQTILSHKSSQKYTISLIEIQMVLFVIDFWCELVCKYSNSTAFHPKMWKKSIRKLLKILKRKEPMRAKIVLKKRNLILKANRISHNLRYIFFFFSEAVLTVFTSTRLKNLPWGNCGMIWSITYAI